MRAVHELVVELFVTVGYYVWLASTHVDVMIDVAQLFTGFAAFITSVYAITIAIRHRKNSHRR